MAKREKAFEEARKKRLERRASGGGSAQADPGFISQKMDSYYESIEAKYPRVAKNLSYFREVWDETFPSPEKEMRRKQDLRKNLAKAQREEEERLEKLTPEEIEEMEKSIPEWKRNALVTTDAEVVEEKLGMF